MSREDFIATFGGVFERSPWVAELAWDGGIGEEHDEVESLHALMASVVRGAPPERRLELLRSHPRLAAPVPEGAEGDASRGEQARAGLAGLDGAGRMRFAELNEKYEGRHGFPFILAVEGMQSDGILAEFERRCAEGDSEAEMRAAVEEVIKIAGFRLARM